MTGLLDLAGGDDEPGDRTGPGCSQHNLRPGAGLKAGVDGGRWGAGHGDLLDHGRGVESPG